MNVIRGMMGAVRPIVRARRAVLGPRRPGWSEDFEVFATVLRSSSSASTFLPLAWQRAITDPPRPATRAVRETRISDIMIPGLGGAPPVRAMRFDPADADPSRAFVYLHGGGYSIGSLRSHQDLIARMARASGVPVIAPAYRLAPEHRFPAQLEDARAVFTYVTQQMAPAERVVIGGESAGAGLTLSLALALREAGAAQPAGLVTISPWVDLEGRSKSYDDARAYDFVTRYAMRRYASRFVSREDLRNPLAAPIHADLRELPPLLIHVGAVESLRDEGLHLAQRAREAGVDVTLQVYPDMIHAFHVFAPVLPAAREAIEDVGRFVTHHSTRPGPRGRSK